MKNPNPDFRPLHPDDVDSQYHGGDWPQAFPEALAETYATYGFDRANWDIAIDALRRLYPPELSRRLLLSGWDGWLVFPLMIPNAPICLIPRLRLGLDLHVAQPWGDAELLKGLRGRSSFSSAAFELSVWANLLRCGYEVERHPCGPPSRDGRGVKRADFATIVDHRRYVLELKDIEFGEQELLAGDLANAMSSTGADVTIPNREVVVYGSSDICKLSATPEGRLEIRRLLPEFTAAFTAAVMRIHACEAKPGTYEISSFGELVVREAPEFPYGAFGGSPIPKTSDDKVIARMVTEVRHSCDQISNSGVGLSVLRVGRFQAVERFAEALRRAMAGRPDKFSKIGFVVLLLDVGAAKERPVLLSLRSTPSEAERRLVNSLVVRPSGAEPMTPVRTNRVGLGGFAVPQTAAGARMSIRFGEDKNGLPRLRAAVLKSDGSEEEVPVTTTREPR
jgi:hypothetical protein